MLELTAFQRDILYVISGLEQPSGSDILDDLDDYYENEIHHGRLYPSLDDLVEQGYLEKGKKDDRTNEYTLTDHGIEEIDARREWEDKKLE